MLNLEGKRALVTGGGTGIGRGIALALAEAGADVIVHYGKNRKGADEVVQLIQAKGRRAMAVQADVLIKDEIVSLLEKNSALLR